jgi:ketosteroid isomerase-like protein
MARLSSGYGSLIFAARQIRHILEYMSRLWTIILTATLCAACSAPAPQPTVVASADDSGAHQAHEAYVTAINSNNLDSLLGMLTEDVVFLSAHEPVMVGKVAVRPWLEGYLKAFKTHWDKPVQEFVVSGEWAFERYSYKSSDTPLAGGPVVEDTGWGLVIYHHDADGKWRVARDAWGPDHPGPAK